MDIIVWYRINMRILHSGPNPKASGIPETMVCRALMFMWSFEPLILPTLRHPTVDPERRVLEN